MSVEGGGGEAPFILRYVSELSGEKSMVAVVVVGGPPVIFLLGTERSRRTMTSHPCEGWLPLPHADSMCTPAYARMCVRGEL